VGVSESVSVSFKDLDDRVDTASPSQFGLSEILYRRGVQPNDVVALHGIDVRCHGAVEVDAIVGLI
jgi:hypothetical protein